MNDINPLEGELLPPEDGEYLNAPAPELPDSVDPADVIKATQTLRMAMVKNELRGGLPRLDKDAGTLLQVLRDMDQAALTTRKIDVEESQLGDAERVAHAQNELLRMLGGTNPFAVELKTEHLHLTVTRPDVALPEPKLVEGIDVQGTAPVDYDDFVGSVDPDAPTD